MSIKFEDERKDEDLSIEYIEGLPKSIVSIIEELMDYLKFEGIVSTKANGVQILLSFEDNTQISSRLKDFNEKIIECIYNKFNSLNVKNRYKENIQRLRQCR